MKHKDIFGPPLCNGEVVTLKVKQLKPTIWTLGCCDCGLYHLFVITRDGDDMIIRPYRDDFLTHLGRKKGKRKK